MCHATAHRPHIRQPGNKWTDRLLTKPMKVTNPIRRNLTWESLTRMKNNMTRINNPAGKAAFACYLFIVLLAASPSSSMAAMGVTADTITFGQSACFSGPNKNLGLYYKTGILAAFREINDLGGINGRTLQLTSRDDAYEPEQAAANAQGFVSENNVLAVIGGVGTPTAKRIAPVLRTADIPFVGPFTGADFLRNTSRFPNVINLRAGYRNEVIVLVDHMVDNLGKERFGVIYQEDAFGRSVMRNYKAALEEHGLHILAKTAYSRNTHAVHASLFSISKAELDAILIIGPYPTNSELINLMHSTGHDYTVANLSFTSSRKLKEAVERPDEKILVTEVVPDATNSNRKVVQRFQRALRANHEPGAGPLENLINEISLEGYILGRFVIHVLERMGNELTRERFIMEALSPEPVAIDDWALRFEPGTNTGSSYIRLTNLGDSDS